MVPRRLSEGGADARREDSKTFEFPARLVIVGAVHAMSHSPLDRIAAKLTRTRQQLRRLVNLRSMHWGEGGEAGARAQPAAGAPGRAAFAWPENKRAAISLSWDDGLASQVEVAMPILESHGFRGSFYVLPGKIEPNLPAWQAAASRGHEIGNHTVRHPCSRNFSWVPPEAQLEGYTLTKIEEEIVTANRRLEEMFGAVPRTFAYCCGQSYVGCGAKVQSYVPVVARHFEVGRGYMAEQHNDPLGCDLAQVFGVPMDERPIGVLREYIAQAKEAGGWLILVGHEMAQVPGQNRMRPAILKLLAEELARDRTLWVDTVASVGRHVAAHRPAGV